jgi:hypothetical protein
MRVTNVRRLKALDPYILHKMTINYALIVFSCGMSVFVLALNEFSYRMISHDRLLRFTVVAVAALLCATSLWGLATASSFTATALRGLVFLNVATPLAYFLTRLVKRSP